MEPLIAVHAVAASLVLTLGPVQFVRRRRDRAHRIVGRTWVCAMATTCVSSFGIHPQGFNWLHGLALFTLVSVTSGVIAILRHDMAAHRRNMIGSYVGTLIAFVFAATMPNRAIARMAIDDPFGLTMVAALVLATSAAIVSATLAWTRATPAPAPSRRARRRTQPSERSGVVGGS